MKSLAPGTTLEVQQKMTKLSYAIQKYLADYHLYMFEYFDNQTFSPKYTVTYQPIFFHPQFFCNPLLFDQKNRPNRLFCSIAVSMMGRVVDGKRSLDKKWRDYQRPSPGEELCLVPACAGEFEKMRLELSNVMKEQKGKMLQHLETVRIENDTESFSPINEVE